MERCYSASPRRPATGGGGEVSKRKQKPLSSSLANDRFIQPKINGARARIAYFIKHHAQFPDDAKYLLMDLGFLVYRARRMK